MNAPYKYDIINHDKDDERFVRMDIVKSLSELSVYDLGSIDHYLFLKRNEKFGFDLEIENEEDEILYKETAIHPYAIESLASFCRCFLRNYDAIADKE